MDEDEAAAARGTARRRLRRAGRAARRVVLVAGGPAAWRSKESEDGTETKAGVGAGAGMVGGMDEDMMRRGELRRASGEGGKEGRRCGFGVGKEAVLQTERRAEGMLRFGSSCGSLSESSDHGTGMAGRCTGGVVGGEPYSSG